MPLDVQAIEANGWQQGSVFTAVDSAALLGNLDLSPWPNYQAPGTLDNVRLIVASHSCDVQNPTEQEQYIEVVPMFPLPDDVGVGMYGRGKVARKLRLALEVRGTPRTHELFAPLRFQIPRSQLEAIRPCDDINLPTDHLRVLAYWLALRFFRVAFPTEFNNRLGNRQRRIRTILEPIAEQLDSVLYALEDDRELPADELYRIVVVLLAKEDALDNDEMREQCDRALALIEEVFEACPGIELDAENSGVRSDSEFTMQEARYFNTWGFEDMSL